MDCKAALAEAEGDVDRAIEILRVKGQASAAKREGRGTDEGVVSAYIHANDKVGAMVEVQCETDFVARNEDFVAFARDVALHIAAANPRYVREEDVDAEVRDREARALEAAAADKPENVRPRIVEGQLKKWLSEIVLLDQPHVNGDKYDGKTIKQLQDELAAKTGENVSIRRFVRFAVGEE